MQTETGIISHNKPSLKKCVIAYDFGNALGLVDINGLTNSVINNAIMPGAIVRPTNLYI
jgi:hypothetical protein